MSEETKKIIEMPWPEFIRKICKKARDVNDPEFVNIEEAGEQLIKDIRSGFMDAIDAKVYGKMECGHFLANMVIDQNGKDYCVSCWSESIPWGIIKVMTDVIASIKEDIGKNVQGTETEAWGDMEKILSHIKSITGGGESEQVEKSEQKQQGSKIIIPDSTSTDQIIRASSRLSRKG